MNNERSLRLIENYGLTDDQKQAALQRGMDVVVTAGAGSGKTRTLVARYASLLAEGLNPRRVVAITFTEKAAREMRARIREELVRQVRSAASESERAFWLALNAQMDSARIGTIHSICAEILRNHPAEAAVDPRFDVLDEGLAAALRAQVVEDTLSGFVDNPAMRPLLESLTAGGVQTLLTFMLKQRLDMQEFLAHGVDGRTVLLQALRSAITRPEIADCISDLGRLSTAELEADNRLGVVTTLLAHWRGAQSALDSGDVLTCAESLYQARREGMNLTSGKRSSSIKDTLAALQGAYDEIIDPFVGGKKKADCPDRAVEERFALLQPICLQAFRELSANYGSALALRQALDFDDLESGAVRLLARPEVRAKWQAELDALLVDEFQDTNARQRQIVRDLAGEAGRLFVVGDARQSIYRFRRADVTVFRALEYEVAHAGGLVLNLERTYRAHRPLLDVTGDVLAGIMGTQDDPARPYQVRFTPLEAHRSEPSEHIQGPHFEILFGVAEETDDARPVMAQALTVRLYQLRQAGQIQSWDEVALLFRASTGFGYYETALEDADIPFVTVAGRGFYDRPEIRDVLNILRALSDPTDDLVMAGLLRSPAFGLSDSALYLLRDKSVPYWQALQGDLSRLSPADQARAQRVVALLGQLLPQVDRISVAELLKQLLDASDYRAILSAGGSSASGRLWRNLDKLLSDALASRQVSVRDFLDYLKTLSDAGAREGEAPAEALGAVRLMTIHKSKGLQFPIVVLADASRKDINRGEAAYLLPETGLALKLGPTAPMLYRLAKHKDSQQDDSESRRVLYVALTRAQEKVIVSGHISKDQYGKWKSQGGMADIAAQANLEISALLEKPNEVVQAETSSGHPVQATACTTFDKTLSGPVVRETAVVGPSVIGLLHHPLDTPVESIRQLDEPGEDRDWRATGAGAQVPPGVVGQLVHKAIERWVFPDDPRRVPLLERTILGLGVSSEDQRVTAIKRSLELLGRLRAHPLWEEIDQAPARYHEVPYLRQPGDYTETGYIDLLYKSTEGWQVVDFKTDIIRDEQELQKLVQTYRHQMQRYADAVQELLGEPAGVRICFLDDRGRVRVVGFQR